MYQNIGRFSLVRLGGLVEQIAELRQQGYEVVLVTSGAVGCGRMHLRKQALLSSNFREQMKMKAASTDTAFTTGYNSACASAGQLGLMSLYETLFSQYDVGISQFLVTSYDFTNESRQRHLQYSIEEIVAHGMVPIINENDAVSGNQGYTAENVFSDNDALASIVAGQLGAQVHFLPI
jgi:delta-1-pyrroline-5-carboxylate synthetase